MKQLNIIAALASASVALAAPLAVRAQQPVTTPATHADTTKLPSSLVPIEVTEPRIDTVDRVVAIVGNNAITWSDLVTAVNQQRAQGLEMPRDSAGQFAVATRVLNDLVDEEILVQKASELSLTVSDADIATQVDQQLHKVRSQFKSDAEYKTELKNAGFGTPEEYRRSLTDQARRQMLQQKAFREISKTAKPGSVTEDDVTKAYDQYKGELQKRPATIAFRQIVIAPRASKFADSVAYAKAESLLVKLRAGEDFGEVAKRESMDPGSAKLGGDLGWNRRGSGFVPEFEAAMFSLPPGRLSPPVKTAFGYHIIRVDRVKPGEVKVRHILISPVVDSNDVQLAYLRADTVAQLWRKGVSFDTLVAKYHDPSEEKGILTPFAIDSLPTSYQTALANVKATQVSDPFQLQAHPGSPPKYAVVQVVTRTAAGEYSLPEVRERIRQQLASQRQARDLLDELRKQTYVSLRM